MNYIAYFPNNSVLDIVTYEAYHDFQVLNPPNPESSSHRD